MSVRKIFTILVGTVVLIVLSSAIIEVFNINVVSQQLKQLTRTSAEQACELFTQESYKKTSDSTYSANMPNINGQHGSVFIRGDIYPNGDSIYIYDYIHCNMRSLFDDVCDLSLNNGYKSGTISVNGNHRTFTYKIAYVSPSVKAAAYNTYEPSKSNILSAAFKNLNDLHYSITKPYLVSNKLHSSDIYERSRALKALKMPIDLVTPTNIGFPFMDADIINNIFQWNLTQLLTRGYNNTIYGSGNNQYVLYNGFKCYTSKAFITELDYYIIDTVGDTSGTAKKYLRDYANIDVSKLNQQGTSAGNENNYIVIVGIKYTMPVEYEGITPAKQIFAYLFSKEVEGLNNQYDGVPDQSLSLNGTNSGEITNNELINDGGALNTFGELYFTLIR